MGKPKLVHMLRYMLNKTPKRNKVKQVVQCIKVDQHNGSWYSNVNRCLEFRGNKSLLGNKESFFD